MDVFGGSGIITLNTAVPKGCLQTYNDLNRDLLTLLTCHPYASGGRQRYVVVCERTVT